MPRLIWSPPALLEVAPLHAFLRPKSQEAASRAVKAGGYVARYHYDGRDVVVLAVRHTKEAGF